MSVYVLPYNSREQLSAHLNAQELRCKCGGTHNITVNTDLIDKIEKLISAIADIKGVPAEEVHINVSFCKPLPNPRFERRWGWVRNAYCWQGI